MREIKFRAFLKEKKKMLPVTYLTLSDEEGEQVGVADCNNEGCVLCVDYYDYEKVELMQYTGLKDKNGREIYEGDVFRWEEDSIGVIKYKDASFYLETNIALPGDSFQYPGFYSPWLKTIKHELETELEIIGNIYEDSHLLEETV